jgi:hypothetical protein
MAEGNDGIGSIPVAPSAGGHHQSEAFRPPHTAKPAIRRALSFLMLGVPCAVRVGSRTNTPCIIGQRCWAQIVSGTARRTIPGFQNSKQVGDIKYAARVSDSSQLRAQREHAQATGREHVVVTGTNSRVSGTVENQSTVIRRDDLGPRDR